MGRTDIFFARRDAVRNDPRAKSRFAARDVATILYHILNEEPVPPKPGESQHSAGRQ